MAEIILGKPRIRGNSDVVFNYGVEGEVKAGEIVKRTGEGIVEKFDGSGAPFGIAGYAEVKGQKRIGVVEAGKDVGVLLADEGEDIEVGGQVFITSAGKVSGASAGNTATAAIFASEKGDAINALTGAREGAGALIDFIGGF